MLRILCLLCTLWLIGCEGCASDDPTAAGGTKANGIGGETAVGGSGVNGGSGGLGGSGASAGSGGSTTAGGGSGGGGSGGDGGSSGGSATGGGGGSGGSSGGSGGASGGLGGGGGLSGGGGSGGGASVADSPVTQDIKMDYFGYRPTDRKVVIFTRNPNGPVYLRNTANQFVFAIPTNGGSITQKGYEPDSNDDIWWVEFDAFTTPGTYRLYVPDWDRQSYDFEIRDDIYNAVVLTVLKTFYYQRCGTNKPAAFASHWVDDGVCHGYDSTLGAAGGQPDYGVRDLSGGWHDAGDYNKYTGSAVEPVLYLLRAHEENPGAFKDGDLTIPESTNGFPDILDEVKWQLDWLLKMQLSSGDSPQYAGAFLRRIYDFHDQADAPPSDDTNDRYYWGPTLAVTGAATGALALAARIFAAEPSSPYGSGYVNTLQSAAENGWAWLFLQDDTGVPSGQLDYKLWAAAEIYRLNGNQDAKTYVESYGGASWAWAWLHPEVFPTHAAIAYLQTPGANPTIASNMRDSMANLVNQLFADDNLYRNGIATGAYGWGGSNRSRAKRGVYLMQAQTLLASHPTNPCATGACADFAQQFLHYHHGQNTMRMTYLTNMHHLGGDHASYQLYHYWFGLWNFTDTYSMDNFLGKPDAAVEPDYPYFDASDNHDANDNKHSVYGPAPGFITSGPNPGYAGTAIPPLNAGFLERYYRDFMDLTDHTAQPWALTEPTISGQGSYVALGAYFMKK